MITYEKDGAAIYRESFATIRAEADLARFEPVLARTVVRMIHSCGMVDLTADVEATEGFGPTAEAALKAGAPILCDTMMVASGITRKRLPADNAVVCTLGEPQVPELARAIGNTRSAAAMELWADQLEGSLVVIEELDNGLHPSRAKKLLESLEAIATRRQLRLLLTTHNPALLDALPESAVPNVAFCYRDPAEGDSRIVRLEEIDGSEAHLLAGGSEVFQRDLGVAPAAGGVIDATFEPSGGIGRADTGIEGGEGGGSHGGTFQKFTAGKRHGRGG